MAIRVEYVIPKIMTRPKDILFPAGYQGEDVFRVKKILPETSKEGFLLDKLPQAIITNKNGERFFRVFSKISNTPLQFEEGCLDSDRSFLPGQRLVMTYKDSITVGNVSIHLDDGFQVCAEFSTSRAPVEDSTGLIANATFFCSFPVHMMTSSTKGNVRVGDYIMYYVRLVEHGIVFKPTNQ
jgi:hypothetical protein